MAHSALLAQPFMFGLRDYAELYLLMACLTGESNLNTPKGERWPKLTQIADVHRHLKQLQLLIDVKGARDGTGSKRLLHAGD
jgi:hypothetical protein